MPDLPARLVTRRRPVGGSMGGSIVEHRLGRSPLADAVVAGVLAPVPAR